MGYSSGEIDSPQNSPFPTSRTSPPGASKKETERRGAIRSVTELSVLKALEDEIKTKQREEENLNDLSILGRMMDSNHSFDEICCATRMPYAFLERQIRSDERCVIISR